MSVRSYQELEVWRKAMNLAVRCYEVTRPFPKDELFGMVSQIRRSAASVPANVAEGHGRHSTKEFLHHLSIARGSLMELETHLILCSRVRLIDPVVLDELTRDTDEISRMLSGLRKALEAKL